MPSLIGKIQRNRWSEHAAREPGEPLSNWLMRAATARVVSEMSGPLRSLLNLHYRYRFDPHDLSQTDSEALRRQSTECLERF